MGTTLFGTDLGGTPLGPGTTTTGGGGTTTTQVPQTTITLNYDTNAGNVQVLGGSLTGPKDRSVQLIAVANPDYKFKQWEVTSIVSLVPYVLVSAQPATSVNEVCGYTGNTTFQNQLARQLYRFPTSTREIYIDLAGTQLISDGYWGAGNNEYYEFKGGALFSGPNVCPSPTTQTGGTGGTGGGVNGSTDVGTTRQFI